MKVVIKQKYFTVGAKFEIKTTEGQTVFFAERQWDRFMGNVVLFDKNGAPVARMQSEFKKVFTSWFSISDSRGNEVCCINEKLPFLCFRRAESSHGNLKVKIKAESFVKSLFLSFKDNFRCVYSDNYLDIEAGDEKIVIIRSEDAIDASGLKAASFDERIKR